ncbi:PaaD-like zinc ribbon domain-containing protein [Gaopeijia maritima]|uniref:PaaD zinc beta ribbon domain-containing protein n=1 Tax=Gaopeijia maritima TaxID=3119007 RepID=A0ABU9E4J5_9BACT
MTERRLEKPRLPASPPCPFCEGRETELSNPFGPHASVASYWCRDCRSPFELLKWGAR